MSIRLALGLGARALWLGCCCCCRCVVSASATCCQCCKCCQLVVRNVAKVVVVVRFLFIGFCLWSLSLCLCLCLCLTHAHSRRSRTSRSRGECICWVLSVCQLLLLLFSLLDFSSVAVSLWHLVDFYGLFDIFLFLLAFLLNFSCLQFHFLYTDLHLFLTILLISYNH